ncbi:unnamed protein product [Camellia sinensis]
MLDCMKKLVHRSLLVVWLVIWSNFFTQMSALEIVCIFYLKHAFMLRFPANRSDNFMKQSQIVEFRMLVEYGRQQMDNFYIVSTSAYITPEPSEVLESGAIWMPEELVILHAIIQ